jgi:hypothetical protein
MQVFYLFIINYTSNGICFKSYHSNGYLSECQTKYLAFYANYPMQLEQYPIAF